MSTRRVLVLVLLVTALLAVLAQEALWAQHGDVEAPPVELPVPVTVFLPTVGRFAGYEMPVLAPGAESFLSRPVDRQVYMGGDAGSSTEWMRATTLVTVIDATQNPPWYWVCWYGQWESGAGAAKCERLDVGTE